MSLNKSTINKINVNVDLTDSKSKSFIIDYKNICKNLILDYYLSIKNINTKTSDYKNDYF
jgi:hypothetical protein